MAASRTLAGAAAAGYELLSLAIRMNNFGPMGDQMADMLSPKGQAAGATARSDAGDGEAERGSQGLERIRQAARGKEQRTGIREKGQRRQQRIQDAQMNRENNETNPGRRDHHQGAIHDRAHDAVHRRTCSAHEMHDSSHEFAGMQKDAQRHGAITQAADHEHASGHGARSGSSAASQQPEAGA
jgi:hypothetical protein